MYYELIITIVQHIFHIIAPKSLRHNVNYFKGAFIAMRQALYLNHDVLAKYNHKGLMVEYFYLLLNKIVTIPTKEHVTNDVWNSVPIDVTPILRSISAIGRGLHF